MEDAWELYINNIHKIFTISYKLEPISAGLLFICSLYMIINWFNYETKIPLNATQ